MNRIKKIAKKRQLDESRELGPNDAELLGMVVMQVAVKVFNKNFVAKSKKNHLRVFLHSISEFYWRHALKKITSVYGFPVTCWCVAAKMSRQDAAKIH